MKTDTTYTAVAKDAPEPQFQLSVVTVCWNALADLKPTIESVLRQKAKGSISIEHLVVDGASTDGTPEWLAEQLAAGNIERYVSEPDRGIYDAMNKGINLARGEVLAFLNAGDTYRADADLAPCVLPICRGETESVAAGVAIEPPQPGYVQSVPRYDLCFLRTPCCHQSFFASARAYRALGGYDAARYKCFADADFMYRLHREAGSPQIVERLMANYDASGVSANAGDDYLDEHLRLIHSHHETVEEMCRRDAAYNAVWQAKLAHTAGVLQDWQARRGRMIPDELQLYAELCSGAARRADGLYAKAALWYLARVYTPRLMRRATASRGMRAAMRFLVHACHVPDDNPYKGELWLPLSPLSSHPLFRLFRRGGRAS